MEYVFKTFVVSKTKFIDEESTNTIWPIFYFLISYSFIPSYTVNHFSFFISMFSNPGLCHSLCTKAFHSHWVPLWESTLLFSFLSLLSFIFPCVYHIQWKPDIQVNVIFASFIWMLIHYLIMIITEIVWPVKHSLLKQCFHFISQYLLS